MQCDTTYTSSHLAVALTAEQRFTIEHFTTTAIHHNLMLQVVGRSMSIEKIIT